MLWIILGILISYLIGAIPTAYILGRLLKGIDIRKFGSGNVGATNALRVLGKGPGIVVLLLDIFKGFVPVFFLADLLSNRITYLSDEALRIIFGISVVFGHNWTIFLRFKGGKGVATTLGVLLGLSAKVASLKLILGLMLLTWLVVCIITRIVSIASVLSAIALPIYMAIFKQSRLLLFTSIILSVFIVIRHKSNLKKVFEGRESRLSFKKG